MSKFIKKNDIIFGQQSILELQKIFVKILEKKSKLKKNKDFILGYSPERINPGDPSHQIEKINKIVPFKKLINRKLL